MPSTILTQNRLKELLHYDPLTGIFTWKVNISTAKASTEAGNIGDMGYRCIGVDNTNYRAHRLAFLYMLGAFPKHMVDHINRVTHDNRWKNLRDVKSKQNQQNRKLDKRNKSGYSGVFFRKKHSDYLVNIKIDGETKHIGLFKDYFNAVCARKSAENRYWTPI